MAVVYYDEACRFTLATNINAWSTASTTVTLQANYANYYATANSATTATSQWLIGPGLWGAAQGWVYEDRLRGKAPAIVSEETRRRLAAEELALQEHIRQATVLRRQEEEQARVRAKALLYSALTRDQQRSLEERKFFELNVGGKTYRIHQGTHGNVRLVQGGRETTSYCAQPDNVPTEDAMLAQKLMLETDEQAFLRVANARFLARAA